MNAHRFKELAACQRAGKAFYKVHYCGQMFASEFNVFTMINEYKTLLFEKKAKLPDGYERILNQAEDVRKALASQSIPLTPCHCDPLAENILDAGDKMYIIDWEYAGNNDPMWDLGDLAVEAEMSSIQEHALLEGYFAGSINVYDHARMIIYKAMSDLLWTLWGVIQHVNNNPVDDFWAYALNRFERCKKLMETKEFYDALKVIQKHRPLI